MIETPIGRGEFVGDVWFGHPDHRTLGTHWWDGGCWVEMPSLSDSLIILLAKSKRQNDEAQAEIARLQAELDTAWDEAIEAAAQEASEWWAYLHDDQGRDGPVAAAIRALKRSQE